MTPQVDFGFRIVPVRRIALRAGGDFGLKIFKSEIGNPQSVRQGIVADAILEGVV